MNTADRAILRTLLQLLDLCDDPKSANLQLITELAIVISGPNGALLYGVLLPDTLDDCAKHVEEAARVLTGSLGYNPETESATDALQRAYEILMDHES